ncbi:MAG: rhodanese-related sulfurtransferase [Saprospiraceae bacterium]|jgi:rhodanese-related sulfurtransferase
MDIEFFSQNWILFLALAMICTLIIMEPMRQKALGVKMVNALRVPQIMNHDSAKVVDVSKAADFAAGHIPDAINLPMDQISEASEKLAKFKDKPIILTCRTGSRANAAAAKLAKQGFSDLYVLSGGFAAWQKEKLPVKKA